MLKILGSLIVIGASGIIGFLYSRVYGERVRQLREIQYSLNMLETEIMYNATPLAEALMNISKDGGSIKGLFVKMAEILRGKKTDGVLEAYKMSYEESKMYLCFNREEADIIAAFMQSLGGSDIEGQKKNFNLTIKKLEEFEKKADEVRNKNEKLYRYLGVCLGVLIVIILV